MRIFLTLHPSANLSVPGSMTWYHNLYEPLLDIGHEVVLLRMDEVAIKHKIPFRGIKFKEIFSNELIDVFNKEHSVKPFDLFFSYLTDNDVDEEAIQRIKKTGVPMANFSCNNTHQFYLIEKISPFFDYNLHSEKNAQIKFRGIGAHPVWFPMAANPKYYFPEKKNFKYDVSFIGAAYAKRAYYISQLMQENISVNCFGPNWLTNQPYARIKEIKKEIERTLWLLQTLFSLSPVERLKKTSNIYHYDLLLNVRKLNSGKMHFPCSDHAMKGIINESKINLGFLEVYSGFDRKVVLQHLHLREFEIPMCGGLYVTNYSDELSEFYEIDKEVITFRNELELVEKVKFLLLHDNEANMVRNAAHKRALNEHTYQNRFTRLFKNLNIK